MTGEKDLTILLKTMRPTLNAGDYVFCSLANPGDIHPTDCIFLFREQEGITVIVKKELADQVSLPYSFIAAWITLTVHSSLEAVGLTAAFSSALAKEGISCNVVAASYHDHLFVDRKDADKAMEVLNRLSSTA